MGSIEEFKAANKCLEQITLNQMFKGTHFWRNAHTGAGF